jgi:hypothetical protein
MSDDTPSAAAEITSVVAADEFCALIAAPILSKLAVAVVSISGLVARNDICFTFSKMLLDTVRSVENTRMRDTWKILKVKLCAETAARARTERDAIWGNIKTVGLPNPCNDTLDEALVWIDRRKGLL